MNPERSVVFVVDDDVSIRLRSSGTSVTSRLVWIAKAASGVTQQPTGWPRASSRKGIYSSNRHAFRFAAFWGRPAIPTPSAGLRLSGAARSLKRMSSLFVATVYKLSCAPTL
jgi:hypothetical protein